MEIAVLTSLRMPSNMEAPAWNQILNQLLGQVEPTLLSDGLLHQAGEDVGTSIHEEVTGEVEKPLVAAIMEGF